MWNGKGGGKGMAILNVELEGGEEMAILNGKGKGIGYMHRMWDDEKMAIRSEMTDEKGCGMMVE